MLCLLAPKALFCLLEDWEGGKIYQNETDTHTNNSPHRGLV